MRRFVLVGLTFAFALSSVALSAQQAPVRVGGQIQPPQKIRHVDPVYPSIAQANRVEGIVILELTIGEDGYVRNTEVLRSVPVLDQAALDAVRQWVFTPTLMNGVPQAVIYTVTVTFKLAAGTPAANASSGLAPSAPGRMTLFGDGTQQAIFDIPVDRLASLPQWTPGAGAPPLSSAQAASIATNWLRDRQPGMTAQLADITLRNEESRDGRAWFYVARFSVEPTADAIGPRGSAVAIVLLDGSIVEPRTR